MIRAEDEGREFRRAIIDRSGRVGKKEREANAARPTDRTNSNAQIKIGRWGSGKRKKRPITTMKTQREYAHFK